MQGAGQGISSARLLRTSKPVDDAADGVIDRLADGAHAAQALGAQLRMAGSLRLSRSCGPPPRLRARHAGRTPMAGPQAPPAMGTGIAAIEGRTGGYSAQRDIILAAERRSDDDKKI